MNEGKHIHFPAQEIIQVVEGLDVEWARIKETYDKTVEKAKISYDKVKSLIRYFEQQVIDTIVSNNP